MILVRAGEMAVQRLDRESVESVDLGGSKTEAIDAGIDHHVAGAARCDLLPAGDLLDRVQASPRTDAQRSFAVVRADAMKDDQACLIRKVAERLSLSPGGHEEVAAA